jgi:hypothetical protein
MLFGLIIVCSLLAGATAAANPANVSVHSIAFALLLVVSLYVILDLEFPRFGFVRIDAFDKVLVDVHAGMVLPP